MVLRKKRDFRDTISFILGAAGLYHETVIYGGTGDREVLIIAFCALMGVPIFLRADEKKAEEDDGKD